MTHLTPDECRVLGVLVEKAQTTPAQYPITLNALVAGANQKNNRFPVTELTEDRVLDAVDGLRAQGFVREAMLSGSRVPKYRHVAREALEVDTPALVVLAELLLRGPQSVGELRGRAARMHPLDSLEVVQGVLDGLMGRAEPLVRELPPPPGSRANRYAQLLRPDLHALDAVAPAERAPGSGGGGPVEEVHAPGLTDRVERLEGEVAVLREAVRRLAGSIGEPDPFA